MGDMGKFSDLSHEEKLWVVHRLDAHTQLIIRLFGEANLRALKYLMFVNTGGAIATASFMGTKGEFGADIVLALEWFIAGIMLAGVLTAFGYHISVNVLSSWSQNIDKFYGDEISAEELDQKNRQRASWVFKILDPIFGYGSFVCFFVGCYLIISELAYSGCP